MLTLCLPQRTAPMLALTAVATVARAITGNRREKPSSPSHLQDHDLDQHKPSSVELEWNNVRVALLDDNAVEKRVILENVSGVARPGTVCAILGPSGSGKTTLLNVLAGRVPYAKRVIVKGDVCVNQVQRHTQMDIAYVTQEDLFFSQMTVRETLAMAADMRGAGKHVVDELLRRLALVKVADTRIGDEKNRGISGGEKKRLSLACELIDAPKLILCDEPTSGLDAYQAEKVMASLKQLAKEGHTVVCSIHQPSAKVFEMVDDLVLMADGRVVYAGEKEGVDPFLDRCDVRKRDWEGGPEWYLEVVSKDYTTEESEREGEERITKLVKAFQVDIKQRVAQRNGANKVGGRGKRGKGLGCMGRIKLLLVRAWKQMIRDKKTMMSRFMSSFMSALLFGAIYWKIGLKQSSIQNRFGLLQVCTINCAMTAMVKTLNVFPKEAVLVNRERARGCYNILQYFVSKLLAEMPISAFFPLVFCATVYPMAQLTTGLDKIVKFTSIITLESFAAASYGLVIGALIPNSEAALAVGPSSFVLQIVFGGLYVTDDGVPKWAQWIPRISLIKHAFEGLCVNEMKDLTFETSKNTDLQNGQQVLERVTWGQSTVFKTLTSQTRVLLFNYLATYAILVMRKPRYAQMQPIQQPNEETNHQDKQKAQ